MFFENFRFPGQYYDEETGLHYNWHRYYDPSTGRYLTPDPIGLAGGLNLYLYSNANPINLTDPWGLVSAGQLGIGNPGSYGGSNNCDSIYDDLSIDPYLEGYIPIEMTLGIIAPGGIRVGQLGRGLIGKPFPVKPGYMGRAQPYNPSNGKYLPFSANPGLQLSPIARFGAGFGQGWAEAHGASGATPVGKAGNIGYIIGSFVGNIF